MFDDLLSELTKNILEHGGKKLNVPDEFCERISKVENYKLNSWLWDVPGFKRWRVTRLNAGDRLQVLNSVAYPKNNKSKEEEFFSTFRDLVVTGYFTSEVGIKDLGYKGNQPNVWDGVPKEILKEHGLSYDKSWESKFIDQSKRNDIAVWDDEGNLIS